MPAPKGMRAVNLPVNQTDAVHIYSDAQHIWLQLRRHVPTIRAVGNPSFKVALDLTPKLAMALAAELLTAATQHQHSPATPQRVEVKAAPVTPAAAKAATPLRAPIVKAAGGNGTGDGANIGKPWTDAEIRQLARLFGEGKSIPELAKVHQRSPGGIEARLFKLGKITEEQRTTPSGPTGR